MSFGSIEHHRRPFAKMHASSCLAPFTCFPRVRWFTVVIGGSVNCGDVGVSEIAWPSLGAVARTTLIGCTCEAVSFQRLQVVLECSRDSRCCSFARLLATCPFCWPCKWHAAPLRTHPSDILFVLEVSPRSILIGVVRSDVAQIAVDPRRRQPRNLLSRRVMTST